MRFLIPFLLLAAPVLADPPAIEKVTAHQSGDGWRFDVTLRHPDTGWDHYADGWRVLDMQGRELGMRTLFHPHETEQPFTRSLGGVVIPEGTAQVQIEARCNVDGWAPLRLVVDLP
ncbi:hypothetical protein KQ247_06465 [Ruegeria pomeroyi]|uniref:Lipoprotein n=2 Tax=Ruegeria pomeroyi TaxID=89184 RepID=Q5LMT6_RUEPO|nr:hypothetical protein [Ruegeria pomeroyi]HCE69797.1 hypothetical protein [Ruegeria sp.]AAV96702.1 hypothetical protein SPO3476 [Ruegeria pomeroyi DSS-3]NVK98748.1 hypothetical protein [Ruegeria pomeroyi]NVL03797.1 hypothetical protein [Ruegeria pomeroyi]QWV10237.1 hypothetical protein KQ247_06465 [Ruegeria pomeroyi]